MIQLNCSELYERCRWALHNRHVGGGCKSPAAATLKRCGGERIGKRKV